MDPDFIEIDNWATVYREKDDYLPPEAVCICLRGTVTNHPKYPGSNKNIVTSPVTHVVQNIVTTRSGSVYKLKTPNPIWLDWLKSIGEVFDPENPIRIKHMYGK